MRRLSLIVALALVACAGPSAQAPLPPPAPAAAAQAPAPAPAPAEPVIHGRDVAEAPVPELAFPTAEAFRDKRPARFTGPASE